MIISHKYKFIFIKTQKTAGTSIEVFLSQHCGEKDVLTPIHPHVKPHEARNYRGWWNPLREMIECPERGVLSPTKQLLHLKKFYNHIPARLVKCRIAAAPWKNYFKFCVERNPWDKTLSHYHMVKDRAGGSITFDDYLATGNFVLNYPSYTDARENMLVDKVLKYESLNQELAGVFAQLGVPFDGTLGVRAKSEHRKDRSPYQSVYTPEQSQLIEKAFAKEIQMHGYEY
jgi:hypothetical protein